MTNFKAIILADAHIGADKFDASPDRWDSPVRQAFEYAVASKADVVISCGDFMHKRNPTVAELLRRRNLKAILDTADIGFLEVDGNHDRSNAEGSHSGLEIEYSYLIQGSIHAMQWGQVNMIGLPWPRPVDYLSPDEMNLNIDEKISATRVAVISALKARIDHSPDGPTILFGHAMLAYGRVAEYEDQPDQISAPYRNMPKDPGLILGKDVVLPYQAFIDAGLTANQIFMGHVHDPSSLGYVGSTQPTDWSDAEHDKSFVELDIVNCDALPEEVTDHAHLDISTCSNGWVYYVTRHSYTDQIRLHDIVLDGTKEFEHRTIQLKDDEIDVARVTLNLGPDDREDEAAIRQIIDNAPNYGRLDRVIINHPKREAARVETEVAMADMKPQEAFALWMGQAGYSAEDSLAPYKEFQSLIETSK